MCVTKYYLFGYVTILKFLALDSDGFVLFYLND